MLEGLSDLKTAAMTKLQMVSLPQRSCCPKPDMALNTVV